jgi:hypothetical protein
MQTLEMTQTREGNSRFYKPSSFGAGAIVGGYRSERARVREWECKQKPNDYVWVRLKLEVWA